MNYELVKLADKINWQVLRKNLTESILQVRGRPAFSTRLMVGLQFFKSTVNLSGEETVSVLMQNVHWQFVFVYFKNKLP